MLDFTYEMYRYLCRSLLDAGYHPTKMENYPDCLFANRIFLRHDVDRSPKQALEMAKIEKEFGIVSTYFFRTVPQVYDKRIIEEIVDLGFEIGYHYEVLDKAHGDYAKAIALFEQELTELRALFPVRSISMHGVPFSPYDNRDLWKKYDFRDYGIKVAAYHTLDFTKVRYLSDTGRTWDTEKSNLKDLISDAPEVQLAGTCTLIGYLSSELSDTCLLIHPNRWTNQPAIWIYNLGYDMLSNVAKMMIKKFRGVKRL